MMCQTVPCGRPIVLRLPDSMNRRSGGFRWAVKAQEDIQAEQSERKQPPVAIEQADFPTIFQANHTKRANQRGKRSEFPCLPALHHVGVFTRWCAGSEKQTEMPDQFAASALHVGQTANTCPTMSPWPTPKRRKATRTLMFTAKHSIDCSISG